MKTLLFLLAMLLLSSFTRIVVDPVNIGLPLILALITGIWEVVGRLIPSVGQITIIGKIIELLNGLSNLLNRKK